MSPDQLTFDNPVERHSHIKPHASWQPVPGLDAKLDPKADHGETTLPRHGAACRAARR